MNDLHDRALRYTALGFGLSWFLCGSLSAQSPTTIRPWLSGAVGVLHTADEGTGLGLVGSYNIGNSFVALGLTPLDLGMMAEDPNGRFRSESTSNGNTICRDHDTGQFADRANCGPRFVYAASADAIAALPIGDGRSLSAGGGYRIGNSPGAYVVANMHFGPLYGRSWRLSARVGASFFDLSVGGALPLRLH